MYDLVLELTEAHPIATFIIGVTLGIIATGILSYGLFALAFSKIFLR